MGLAVTLRLEVFPLPHPFCGVTVMVPEMAVTEKSTVTELVPWPETIITPAGTTHWYEVASVTGSIE